MTHGKCGACGSRSSAEVCVPMAKETKKKPTEKMTEKTAEKKTKKILLGGFYGCGNLGDDAMLLSLLRVLCPALPTAKFFCLTGGDLHLSEELGKLQKETGAAVTEVPRMQLFGGSPFGKDPEDVLRAICESDVLLLGGGSLLQNRTGTASLLYYLSFLTLPRLLGKKTALLAGGLGPLDGGFARFLTGRVLCGTDLVSFRDRDAQALAESLGVRTATLSGDLTLLCSPRESGKVREVRKRLPARYFLVSLRRPLRNSSIEDRVATSARAAATVRRIEREKSAVPVFCDLFPKEDASYTAAVLRAYRMQSGRTAVRLPRLSPDELLALTETAVFVLTARYHLALFAYSRGVPFETVCNDPKLRAVARETRPRENVRAALCEDLRRFLRLVDGEASFGTFSEREDGMFSGSVILRDP